MPVRRQPAREVSDVAGPLASEPPAEPTAALPDDPAILRQMIYELLDTLRQTRRENEQLHHRLDLLLRRLFGPRTERFDPDQILLIPDAFEPVTPEPADAAPPPPEPRTEPAKKARPHGSRGTPVRSPAVKLALRMLRSAKTFAPSLFLNY